ncbi:hypothetical protein BO70DRAFT_364055 [Aspergillus heteromorphus CBS 117.55]|uniref:Yeast cell wall synthesis Kre9/Knh1-like N-terminal domain-containing protein n=1 Tax=Aspergillus heteromorphus CBS 117.55 TaxID=1448321 RepID=A0A317VRJ7_9EURO|nr:uncharacterized protein BO70DRAFT_364055 [Aspergillus heteromorphus CBS 117.55]PWY75512.1 hypothetical protein BO70DRAFT_364055 [Aspergillus heteromorphus CBS 117.55]
MRSSLPFLVSLTTLASAISITQPALNSTYAAGSTITVNWTTVDTDPTTFSLYLWNFVYWPPTYSALALDIPTSELSHAVQIPCDATPEWGYQISGINGTNVYIIYAQSDRFFVSENLDAESCVDTTTATPSTCAAASTVYVTPGTVPKTIGWNSDYSHPVTLDHVPTPAPVASASSGPDDFHTVRVTTTLGVAGGEEDDCGSE